MGLKSTHNFSTPTQILPSSEEKLAKSLLRLLSLSGVAAHRVFPELRVERGYFVIEKSLFLRRPDLMHVGRAVLGTAPLSGQGRHSRSAFFAELAEAIGQLEIPAQLSFPGSVPAQFRVAWLFAPLSQAMAHRALLERVMGESAERHHLVILSREEPFPGIPDGPKESQWSMVTDTGANLLDPKRNPSVFLTLLTAILRTLQQHGSLLESLAAFDCFVGRPPLSLFPLFLGENLTKCIYALIEGRGGGGEKIALELATIPHLLPRSTDPSPLSFTGHAWTFQEMDLGTPPFFPLAVFLPALIADQLQLLLDEMADVLKDRKLTEAALLSAVLPVLAKHLQEIEPLLRKTPPKGGHCNPSFVPLGSKNVVRALAGVMSEEELEKGDAYRLEHSVKAMSEELREMIELFETKIFPAVQKDSKGKALLPEAVKLMEALKKKQGQLADLGWEAKRRVFVELIAPQMVEFRKKVQVLQGEVDPSLWPLPNYGELLF